MSHRPTIDKKIARLRKAVRTPLPVSFDLVEWLKARRYAQTTGEANRLILDGRVRSGSHVIGQEEVPYVGPTGELETQTVVQRFQPTRLKDELIVLEAS